MYARSTQVHIEGLENRDSLDRLDKMLLDGFQIDEVAGDIIDGDRVVAEEPSVYRDHVHLIHVGEFPEQ